MKFRKSVISLMAAGVVASPLAYATNGMNLAGYGPVSESMGGTSMAYDNGTAATMNNPATLGLMADGTSRLDVALGDLAPRITTSYGGMSVDSSATAFYMPAIGYAKRGGKMTYGVGVFSQGGMGTEYDANSFMAAGSGDKVRSEVGVGRLIIPLVYQIDDKFNVGGSLDYVWAGMDLKMALPASGFFDMLPTTMNPGATQSFGSVNGSMLAAVGPAVPNGPCGGAVTTSCLNWARVDFSNTSAFSGKATGDGYAFKLGGTYKVNGQLTLGAAYHSKTKLSDLTTGGASMTVNYNDGTGTPTTMPIAGSVSVHNFQWPATYAIGAAYQANDQLMLMADYKHIGWKSVMKDFSMTFTSASPAIGSVDMTLFQNWKDQNVYELGGAYKMDSAWTFRAGLNIANNPVPDFYMNPLFPAIAKNHVTLGVGYNVSQASSVDFSYVYVPKVSATNGQGMTVDFGGFSAQLMYSYRF